MAWAKFTVLTKTAVGTGMKVSLRKAKSGGAQLGITASDVIAKQFDWRDGDKLEVLIGEGEHHGLVRLRKNNSAGSALVSGRNALHNSHYFRVALGHCPAFVDRSEAARWARFESAGEGWVEVTMPLWAQETAPARNEAKTASPPSPAIAAAAAFQRPRRDAAPALMGDPPKGRSALAAAR